MRRQRWSPRLTTTIVVGAATLAAAVPAWAGNASLACRQAIAKGSSKLIGTGYKDALACRKAADKAGQATGPCDVPGSSGFDPKGSYSGAKTKAQAAIGAKCQAGDPVLGNYDNGDPAGAVFPEIDGTIGSNQLTTAGNINQSTGNPPDLGDRIKCVEAIVKAEGAIVKEMIKNATKCQKGKDKTASSFDALDPTCLPSDAPKSHPKATAAIDKACGTLNPSDIGSCSPLPDCAISGTIAAAQDMAQAIYFEKAAASTCGNGTVEAGEQCDDGASNGQPGDLCNTKCESLAETCGPGTAAGGTISGHRIVTVNLNVPAGQLAGVQVSFDYPQLEASIPGTGNSSVVKGAVQVFPSGGLLAVNDTDNDFHFALASTSEFIGSGPLFTATLDQCVPLDQAICNRSQNVVGCCPAANLDACNVDQANIDDPAHFAAYFDDCQCGIGGGVSVADCTTNWKFFADHGACTVGACASPPATIKCGHGCTAGATDKINHACTTATDCQDAGTCDAGTLTCTAGEPTKIGTACTVDADCDSAAGVCSSGNICTAGDATRIGLACSINNDCGTPLTLATCESCPELGDRNNGTWGCFDAFTVPECKQGHFPAQAVGGCDGSATGPIGGCPGENTCETQASVTTASCSVINPVDHLGQPVDGVTCSIDVSEAP